MFPLNKIDKFTTNDLFDHIHILIESRINHYNMSDIIPAFILNYNLNTIRRILLGRNRLTFSLLKKYEEIYIHVPLTTYEIDRALRYIDPIDSSESLKFLDHYDKRALRNMKITHTLRRRDLKKRYEEWKNGQHEDKYHIPYMAYMVLIPKTLEELENIKNKLEDSKEMFEEGARYILKASPSECLNSASKLFTGCTHDELEDTKKIYTRFFDKHNIEKDKYGYDNIYNNLNCTKKDKKLDFKFEKEDIEGLFVFRKFTNPLEEEHKYVENDILLNLSKNALKTIIIDFFEDIKDSAIKNSSISVSYHISKFIETIFIKMPEYRYRIINLLYVLSTTYLA